MKLKYLVFASHLDDDEEVLFVAHRHLFIYMMDSYKVFFLGIALPFVAYYFFPSLLMGELIWLGVGVIGMIYYFFDWYFDAWLVTNQGVIDIERNGLFDRNSTRVDYHMIEGMAYSIKGVWNTIFNFGDITIDKLGARTTLVLKDAGSPKRIERTVMRFQDKFVNERSMRDHETLKGLLSEMLAHHASNPKSKKR